MLLEEIYSPAFAISKNGKVTVFLPELVGEPETPEISYLFENSLFFKRAAGTGCPITGVPEDVVQQLRSSDKMLGIEIDLDKVSELNEGRLTDPSKVFKRYYEAMIDRDSFAENSVDAI